jgi:hypothetical protein
MRTRFFFHLIKGRQRIVDRIGILMPPEAVTSPSVLEAAKDIWPGIDDRVAWAGWSIEICDAQGNVVRVVALG